MQASLLRSLPQAPRAHPNSAPVHTGTSGGDHTRIDSTRSDSTRSERTASDQMRSTTPRPTSVAPLPTG